MFALVRAATPIAQWSRIDWQRYKDNYVRPKEFLDRAMREGVFDVYDEHIAGGAQHDGNMASTNMLHLFGVDGTDEPARGGGRVARGGEHGARRRAHERTRGGADARRTNAQEEESRRGTRTIADAQRASERVGDRATITRSRHDRASRCL